MVFDGVVVRDRLSGWECAGPFVLGGDKRRYRILGGLIVVGPEGTDKDIMGVPVDTTRLMQ